MKRILAAVLIASLVLTSGVPRLKASPELSPSISEAISSLPVDTETQGMLADFVERYSEVRGGVDEEEILKAMSSIDGILLEIKPRLTPSQIKDVLGWVVSMSPKTMADLDDRSLVKLVELLAGLVPPIFSKIDDVELILEWILGFPIDDAMSLYVPKGDFEEYVKGAPKKYCWAGILGPWTGPEGGFMADTAPLLGLLTLLITGAASLKGVANMDLYLTDTRGEAMAGIAAFEKWKGIPHRSPMVLAYGPEATLYDLKGAGVLGFNPGGPGIDREYRHENWVSTTPLVEEASADLARYALMEWPKETGKPRPQKIGFLIQSGASLTSKWYEAMFKDVIASDFFSLLINEFDIELVGTQTFPLNAPHCTPQLVRLRDAGAEWIFTAATASSSAVIAKSAKSLKLKDVQFAANVYGVEHSVIDICGPEAVEGWIAGFNGVSMDDPNLTGKERRGQRTGKLASELAGIELYPATIGIQEPATAAVILFKLVTTCLDRVGGWSNADDINSEMLMEELFKLCGGGEPYWEPIFSLKPVIMLPGRTSSILTVMVDVHDGKLYEHTRRDGKHWQWVPPKVVPGPGPCPPDGWVAPPLEGSIDYGPPWGEWDFSSFVQTYDPPLWWLLMEYGASRSDNVMRKNLFFKTLDKYFEAKEMNNTQRVKVIEENIGMYSFPPKWIGWFKEYVGKMGPDFLDLCQCF